MTESVAFMGDEEAGRWDLQQACPGGRREADTFTHSSLKQMIEAALLDPVTLEIIR